MSDPRPIFQLQLRPEPGGDRAEWFRRLRGALKTLLRGWRLRCVDVREVQPNGESKPIEESEDAH